MLLAFRFTLGSTAPSRLCGRASDGHESSSFRLAGPSVATRNGLASPAQTGASLICNFALSYFFARRLPATTAHRRADAPSILLVQLPQQPVPQLYLVPPWTHFSQSYSLPAEGFPNKTQPPFPPDLSVTAHLSYGTPSLIAPLCCLLGILAPRTAIQSPRLLLTQRLVRSLLIELFNPPIKTSLLGRGRVSRRSRRLGFERSMHPLVCSIFLRTARPDKLHGYAQTQPPYAQCTQSARSRRTKRWPIIHSNCLGLPIPLEPLLKLPLHSFQPGLHYLTAQDVATKPVTGRQRI